MKAFCDASGVIEFGKRVLPGCMPIADGPAKLLREFIAGRARHGYETRTVRGKPEKIPGTECLLVPGVPEAETQSAGMIALERFNEWIRKSAPAGVRVYTMR